ncbi:MULTISPECIES: pyridoxamine 5'-phosphate oxidase family protein [unclassified Aeromicrobium]|jgi:general stress protein 26|uniref:pyridoxamine 5'-phosphate oxidase family protein n=1 Tax=unclassified Aeromicrobium TaxID=2633570 RepID=UPI000AEF82B0|nr:MULTISPECIES: pyridoxamine 5'-phosphate oxidase family protein [unclassified Aeromicrobium]
MSDTTDEKTLDDLLTDLRIAMFTTITDDGTLRSIPMARQDTDLDPAELWFITAKDTEHTRDVAKRSDVQLTFSSSDSWVALTGHAEVVDDLAKLKELWNTFAEAWLPEGPEGDNSTLIKVRVDKAEYWDTPGSKVASAISLVKSKLTGEPYKSDHGVVENP